MLFQIFKEQEPVIESDDSSLFCFCLRQFLVQVVKGAFDNPAVMVTGIIPNSP